MKIVTGKLPYFLLLIFVFAISCNNQAKSDISHENSFARDSVQVMMHSIVKDLSQKGPIAWLSYFENTPEFFMVSNGRLEFPNIDTAKYFIKHTLVKIIAGIELRWGNIRIDVLTNEWASVSAVYYEDIKDSSGKTMPYHGYFTAIAHRTSEGWKLRNLHWSGMTQ